MRSAHPRQVESGTQPSHPSSIQHRIRRGREQISAWREAIDAFVEGNRAAAGRAAFRLTFWALIEITEPSQIRVGSRFDQKDFDLVIGRARTFSALISSAQRRISGATQCIEPGLGRNPYRQIEIFAFMPYFDPSAPEFSEPWDFLPQRLGHRADNGDRFDLVEAHQRVGHDICGCTKVMLQPQHVAVLLFDLGAFQGSPRKLHDLRLASRSASSTVRSRHARDRHASALRKLSANAESASASRLAVSGGGSGILRLCTPVVGSRSIQRCAGA